MKTSVAIDNTNDLSPHISQHFPLSKYEMCMNLSMQVCIFVYLF